MLTAAPTTHRARPRDVQGRSRVRRPGGIFDGAGRCRTRPARAALGLALVALISMTGCAARRGAGEAGSSSTMVKNEIVARASGVTAELVRIEYGPESVQLRVELHNREDAPLSLDRTGVLLAHDGLEYPARPASPRGPDPVLAAPRQSVAFDVIFELGRPLGGDARLMLRTLRRGERYLDPLELAVPAVPAALGEDAPPDRQGSRGP